MKRGLATLATVAVVLLAMPGGVRGQATDTATLERGRELTRLFYEGELDTIAADFTEQMATALGGVAGLRTARQQITAQIGEETEVLDERTQAAGEHRVYYRSARFSGFAGRIGVQWTLDADGRIAGFFIRPE